MKAVVPSWAQKRVLYEWDIEEVDPVTEDIAGHHCEATLKGFGNALVIDGRLRKLVLVRSVVSDAGGVHAQEWAYAAQVDGVWALPEMFDEGHLVPKKFHDELRHSGLSVK